MISIRALVFTFMVGIVALAVSMVFYSVAYANGKHPRSEEIFNGNIGPYHVNVFAVPWVGETHISTYVTHPEYQIPITNADLALTLDVLGVTDEQFHCNPVFGEPGWYSVDLPLVVTGEYVVSISIKSEHGPGHGIFRIVIGEQSGVNWALIGIALLLLLLILRLVLGRLNNKGTTIMS